MIEGVQACKAFKASDIILPFSSFCYYCGGGDYSSVTLLQGCSVDLEHRQWSQTAWASLAVHLLALWS